MACDVDDDDDDESDNKERMVTAKRVWCDNYYNKTTIPEFRTQVYHHHSG
jgi:hypothetical protein